MENELQIRPTSGASPDRIATQLASVRRRTLALVDDLTDAQFMGPMLPVVNPILWEIGHVGWFHEFWTLRHLERRPPLIARADQLWDSSNVAHDTRWDLDLPTRSDVLAYLSRVLDDQLDRLHRGIDDAAAYYYELGLAHEDMHCEALTYMRQTLGLRPPAIAGATPPTTNAGPLPGDVEIPGGTWQLGSSPQDGFVFDNEKWAHRSSSKPFASAAPP